jgi:putative SOS response-associated peptidase YedK
MCGRAFQTSPVERLQSLFGTANPLVNTPPRYNLPPGEDLLTVRRNPQTGARSLDLLHWGLVPLWAKDVKIGFSLINARAETVAVKPAFREALVKRRCLVPIDGFFEWQQDGPKGNKQPYAVAHKPDASGKRLPLTLAGLWERWRSPSGEILRSVSIVTTEANELLRPIHHRMPVILKPQDWPLWLGEGEATIEAVLALLQAYPDELLDIWKAPAAVGNVRNQEATLIEPVE